MKKYYPYIWAVLVLTSCSSLDNIFSSQKHEKELDIKIFNKGVAVFEIIEETSFDYEIKNTDTTTVEGKIKYETLYSKKEDILDFAFEQFEIIIEEYPNSRIYHKSLYNLAYISQLMEYEEEEIKYLEMILNSDANNKENSGRRGIMSNPYANFKNDASNRLTDIYIDKGEFNTALEYKILNEKYPLQHFCGNAYAEDEIHNAKQYAKIYIGLSETEKALNYLLPHIFNNGLASNSDLVDLTVEILQNNYDSSLIKEDFENAMSNFYTIDEKDGKNEWTNYYIKYFDTEIEIPSWTLGYETDSEKLKSELEKAIRESEFYKKLASL